MLLFRLEIQIFFLYSWEIRSTSTFSPGQIIWMINLTLIARRGPVLQHPRFGLLGETRKNLHEIDLLPRKTSPTDPRCYWVRFALWKRRCRSRLPGLNETHGRFKRDR